MRLPKHLSHTVEPVYPYNITPHRVRRISSQPVLTVPGLDLGLSCGRHPAWGECFTQYLEGENAEARLSLSDPIYLPGWPRIAWEDRTGPFHIGHNAIRFQGRTCLDALSL